MSWDEKSEYIQDMETRTASINYDAAESRRLLAEKRLSRFEEQATSDSANACSKREYFAAQALAGIYAHEGWRDIAPNDATREAVIAADALIAALNEVKP